MEHLSVSLMSSQLELTQHLSQPVCLREQQVGRSRCLLDQCRVLLGRVVELGHGVIDLKNARALLGRGRRFH